VTEDKHEELIEARREQQRSETRDRFEEIDQ
jgi:hypothetical protein